MTQAVYLKMARAPSVSWVGDRHPQHTATYQCEMDEVIPSDYAMAVCQGLAGGPLPTDANILPQMGDRLMWDDGALIPDVGQTAAQFQSDHPNGYADFGSTVLNITGAPRVDNCHHDFTVTWQAPNDQGMGQDRKPILDAINGNLNLLPKVSLPATSAQLIAAIDEAIASVKIDYFTRVVPGPGKSYEVTGTTPAGVRTPLFNPVGEKVIEPQLTERVAVYSIVMPTKDDTMASGFEETYQNTVNVDQFTISGRIVPKHYAKFLSAQISDPITKGKLTYRRCSWKIEVANRPYYRRVLAVGSFYKSSDFLLDLSDQDGFGFPIGREYPLKADGTLATTSIDQHEMLRLDYEEEIYSGLIPDMTPPVTP